MLCANPCFFSRETFGLFGAASQLLRLFEGARQLGLMLRCSLFNEQARGLNLLFRFGPGCLCLFGLLKSFFCLKTNGLYLCAQFGFTVCALARLGVGDLCHLFCATTRRL